MKRKEFQETDDDFSPPSLYSPSTKSRRLDSELLRSSEAGPMVDVQEATMGEELEPRNVVGDYIYRPGSWMEARLAEGKSIRGSSNDDLAVVPWIASQPPKFSAASAQVADSTEESEMMDTDESDYNNNSRPLKDFENIGVQQWPQPQLPQWFVPGVIQNTPTPVSW
ncbi:hypothetical protein LINGRAHAP2_LOCUS7616 [Linum grandiflorum]